MCDAKTLVVITASRLCKGLVSCDTTAHEQANDHFVLKSCVCAGSSPIAKLGGNHIVITLSSFIFPRLHLTSTTHITNCTKAWQHLEFPSGQQNRPGQRKYKSRPFLLFLSTLKVFCYKFTFNTIGRLCSSKRSYTQVIRAAHSKASILPVNILN